MNILMVCTEKLPVPNIKGGAIQTYIDGISSILAKYHTITILGRSDPDLPNSQIVDGIRYERVESYGSLDVYLSGVIDFLEQSQEQYDIIHIFNRPRLVLPIRRVAPNSRLILSMHNDMFKPEKLNHQEGTEVVDALDTIITISNYIGHAIMQYYPQAEPKLRTIYSGVDLNKFIPWEMSSEALHIRENLRAEYNLDSKKVILYAGRISQKKGPHVLIKSLSHLQHSDTALVIAGASWYNDHSITDYVAYIRAVAKRSPIPIITTGYIQANEIHKWFYVGDIFVCSSIWEEPLARVHYEAMASGLPFITTARGGNPEIINNNNGLLVNNPEDPLEYANNINKLFSNMDSAREMGRRGRKLAENLYSWENVARNVLAVWDNSSS